MGRGDRSFDGPGAAESAPCLRGPLQDCVQNGEEPLQAQKEEEYRGGCVWKYTGHGAHAEPGRVATSDEEDEGVEGREQGQDGEEESKGREREEGGRPEGVRRRWVSANWNAGDRDRSLICANCKVDYDEIYTLFHKLIMVYACDLFK